MLQSLNWLPRTQGAVRLGFARHGGRTCLGTLHQSGAARVRFPRPSGTAVPEAIMLNTAGGLTGGDSIGIDVALAPDCEATVTTAAAEKVYRSLGDATEIGVTLELADRSSCCWLPQPTILFDGSALDRQTRVRMSGSARLLAVEMLIYGRTAMGEDIRRGSCRDAWRIHRDGRLVFADTVRVSGTIAETLDRTAGGARATAMVIYAAPDARQHLDGVRRLLEHASSTTGASTWNDILLVRAAARDSRELQRDLQPVIAWLAGQPLPRVWQC